MRAALNAAVVLPEPRLSPAAAAALDAQLYTRTAQLQLQMASLVEELRQEGLVDRAGVVGGAQEAAAALAALAAFVTEHAVAGAAPPSAHSRRWEA